MDRDQLKSALNQPYARERWRDIVQEVFSHVAIYKDPQEIPCDHDAVEGFVQIGDVRLEDGKNLALFEIRVAEKVQLMRNRVTLRNIVARHIDQATNHGVLVIFDSHSEDYRFTFAAKESEFDEEGNLVERETATRRYTYVLGPNESCRTAADRFHELSMKRDVASIEDVHEAFSVDKLNKEFFNAYKEHYQRFTDYLIASEYRKTVFGVGKIEDDKERAAAEKPIRDFAKRLLGRIVFLHFLQKKGWLGCPTDRTDWTRGNPRFLEDLFKTSTDQDRFHSSCLVPLFHGALNTPDRPNDMFDCAGLPAETLAEVGARIPYLNGGLFERGEPDVSGIDFPADYFRALLDFFGQYNFTIDENDPEDHEVGIDPEMLGHIFEDLLEERKSTGTYYTPKPVVQYMCQESLIQYLKAHLGDHDELEHLVRFKSRGDEADRNNFIAINAPEIEELLDNVKVCDPAIGSGAFPVGILQEIYWIKLTLDLTLDRAEVKRSIIQNSIYGVDIDAGAVEIARLRFWLSLVVDEEEPSPLPNLDYKIMQGNSLLESFEGIPLGTLTEGQQVSVRVLGAGQDELNLGGVGDEFHVEVDEERRQKIIDLMDRYFSEVDPEEKVRIHEEIDRFVLDHIDYNIALHKDRLEIELHQLRANIKDKQKKAKGYKPSRREEKRLKEIEKEIAADDVRKKLLHELEHNRERPFFLWHLFFQNVFANGGFDIVIANPPYVRHESIMDQKEEFKRAYECYVGTADLFVYFYERSVKLLRDGGVLTYITSNKYYRSAYGKKLRAFLASKLDIQQMIDFGDAPVFDAIAYASIFIGRRTDAVDDGCALRAHKWRKEDKLNEIGKVFRSRSFPVEQAELHSEVWRLESPEVMQLLEKLRRGSTPLGEYVEKRLYFGIKTGLNEAFVVDRATRDRLITEDPKSKEVLLPFLRGRDVKRWRVDYQDLWLIFTRRGTDIDQYPAIKKRLQQYRERLEPRPKNWRGGNWPGRKPGSYHWYEIQDNIAFWQEFEKPKIVYPDIYEHQSYCYDEKGYFSANTTYIIPTDEKWLTALLNSTLIEWFYGHLSNRVRGGYLRAFSDYVEQIPVPSVAAANRDALANLVSQAQETVGSKFADIENDIDQRVYELFDLTSSEIELIEGSLGHIQSAPNVKSDLRSVLLPGLKERMPYFNTDAIRDLIKEKELKISDVSLRHYMSEAMNEGVVHDAGKGWYSGIETACELDRKPVAKVVKLLEKEFPLLEFTCWSTQQINPWMHHILSKFLTFVNVEKDGISAVADVLRDAGYVVHLNPGINRASEVLPNGKTVVVRPLVTIAPRDGHYSPPEGVLVDLYMENKTLNIMGQADFQEMAHNLTSSSRISWGGLLYYAGQREISPIGMFGENNALMQEITNILQW